MSIQEGQVSQVTEEVVLGCDCHGDLASRRRPQAAPNPTTHRFLNMILWKGECLRASHFSLSLFVRGVYL